MKLRAAAIATHVSGLPLHVFHSSAGVRGDSNLFEMAGVDSFVSLSSLVPSDLASWQKHDRQDPAAPIRIYAEDGGSLVPDAVWHELGNPTAGAVEALTATNADDFFVLLLGILDHVVIEARAPVTFDVLGLDASVISSHTLATGEQLTLTGSEAVVLRHASPP